MTTTTSSGGWVYQAYMVPSMQCFRININHKSNYHTYEPPPNNNYYCHDYDYDHDAPA